tara:strand:+ start:1199 stop:1366 length:168 start_codon:yes stop_codon:yes gene_type:complete
LPRHDDLAAAATTAVAAGTGAAAAAAAREAADGLGVGDARLLALRRQVDGARRLG